MSKCLACGMNSGSEQPTYCLSCLIPVPNPMPKPSTDPILETRRQNRKKLIIEIMNRSPAAAEFLESLGLEKMNDYNLAASMSAIGQEKLNLMSSEYSWTEAQTYLDLAYELAQHLDSERLKELTAQRLAPQLIRGGWLDEAERILKPYFREDLGENLREYKEDESVVRAFSNLETFALMQLIQVFRGESWERGKLQISVTHIWDLMRPLISKLIMDRSAKTFSVGIHDQRHHTPRLDKLAFIQSLLVQSEIASSGVHFSDHAVDSLKVMGRMLVILGEMTPDDDPLFYGAVVREYFQLFNGMFWHRHALYENDADTVQTAIVQAHSIVVQWSKLIPPQSWLEARPSRFIEVFYRATRWAGQLTPLSFMEEWMKTAPKELIAYLRYFDAEALLNDGRKEEGEKILVELLEDETLDQGLNIAIQDILNRSALESVGIILGRPFESKLASLEVILEVPKDGNLGEVSRLEELMDIQLPDPRNLMRLEFQKVEERLGRELALRGEVMDNLIYRTPDVAFQYLNQSIIIAGGSYYRDVHWKTPFNILERPVNGLRTEVVVLRVVLEKDILTLLFEAEDIVVREEEDSLLIDTPEFYHLVGIDWTSHPPEELVEVIVELFEGKLLHRQLDIYTLKIDL